MNTDLLIKKALRLEFLSVAQGMHMFEHLPLAELMQVGNVLRRIHHHDRVVTWIIDRNVNITNACISGCKFCNFYLPVSNRKVYITTTEEYSRKIEEMKCLGGNQLLLQGGLHPHLGLKYYSDLFRKLKEMCPELKLHALGPPEIVHIAKMESLSYTEVLKNLKEAGLDSLPGAGAEILSDRVRKIVSPAKATSDEWLDVMHEAHKLNLPTSATMMYGHIETTRERIEHLIKLRDLQSLKPENHYGFITFIPWPFQDEGTVLRTKHGIRSSYNGPDYIRMIAVSRIILNNIRNIQASMLTVGKEMGMLSLHAGANDLGSIMIEENVVSAAGANNRFNAEEMQSTIREAGFVPRRRNQKYESLPPTSPNGGL